ncbi:general substrate transporter [Dichotomopilus funicola]|uniref:General substrate transporter n=1 Tax=Dichotomopilus funicola TaxID=1934379 RepID=A0AAN6ZP51_9PEZI|nr:general substrate transporter [Dichotomopilus funicola]
MSTHPRYRDVVDPVEGEGLLTNDERNGSLELADEGDEYSLPHTPFGNHDSNGNSPQPQSPPKYGFRRFLARFQATQPRTIVILLAVLMFCVATSGMLILIPLFRLLEDAVCHVHYGVPRGEPIDERRCKGDDVQQELAFLGGVAAMVNSFVGLVAAVPYGVLADRIGRKPSFVIAYLGMMMAFAWTPLILAFGDPSLVRLCVFGSLFFLFGGGVPVALNTLHAIASDISSESNRSTHFLYISFGAVSGGLIGPIAAGLMMEHLGPWFPVRLVFYVSPIIFTLVLFLPETLPLKLEDNSTTSAPQSQQPSLAQKIRDEANELAVSFRLLKNRNIALILPAFLIQPALFAAYSSTLAQHISTYFGWTLAQTSYLLSPLSILQLIIIVLVPILSRFLTNPDGRFQLSAFSKDVLLARLSLLLLIAGAVIEGFSRETVLFIIGLVVGTLGASHGPMARAIVTSYVEPQQTSRLYALISMLETGGILLGGPVLAFCFNVGLVHKGVWVGLPWFYVAGIVLLAWVALVFIRAPKKKVVVDGEEGGGNSDDLGYMSAEEQV